MPVTRASTWPASLSVDLEMDSRLMPSLTVADLRRVCSSDTFVFRIALPVTTISLTFTTSGSMRMRKGATPSTLTSRSGRVFFL